MFFIYLSTFIIHFYKPVLTVLVQVTEQRKTDQKAVDKSILDVIRKDKDRKMLFGYLGSRFSLGKGQHPHNLVF